MPTKLLCTIAMIEYRHQTYLVIPASNVKSSSTIFIFHFQVQVVIVKQQSPDVDMVVGDSFPQSLSTLAVDISTIYQQLKYHKLPISSISLKSFQLIP